MKEKGFKIIIVVILITFFISLLIVSNTFLERIILIGALIVFVNICINLIVPKPKNKFIKGIFRILDCISGWIILGLLNVKAYASIILAIVSIFVMHLIPLIIVFSKAISIISYKSCIYIAAISTLVIISYKGYTILDLFIKINSKTDGILNGYANYKSMDILQKINLRKLSYEISITLYIITRVINLEAVKFLATIDMQIVSNLIGEIFLTFVAIDCYICTFKKNIIEKNDIQCLEIKERYSDIVRKEIINYESNHLVR